VNGFLAGLVAITCPCYWVDPIGAFFIGLVGGIVVIVGLEALEWLRIDDPIGAVPVHAFAGIWGTLSLGLFAAGKYGLPTATGSDVSTVVSGLFYGGGTGQLVAQLIGSGATVIASFVVSYIVFVIIERLFHLRLSPDREIAGLDLAEHGASAYPEYVMTGNDGTPKSMDQVKVSGKRVLTQSSAD
jgi:Amt family ammonium transporter